MATKYIARLDGKLVGKRRTESRKYTHAIVAQYDEAKERAAAYGYTAGESDRSEFARKLEIVACEGKIFELTKWHKPADVAGQRPYAGSYLSYTAEEIERAKAQTAGGFDAFVNSRRHRAIEAFELKVARGGFEPHATAWAGRLDLAQKQAAKVRGYSCYCNVWIVPAEVA